MSTIYVLCVSSLSRMAYNDYLKKINFKFLNGFAHDRPELVNG